MSRGKFRLTVYTSTGIITKYFANPASAKAYLNNKVYGANVDMLRYTLEDRTMVESRYNNAESVMHSV